ncbi:hypothetical protein HA466_0291810 [Hirschfeldia incana]|nr:hypothetical protein HA466_0291810 [Hirschfeldia incana]
MNLDDPNEERIQSLNKLLLSAYQSEEAYWKQRSRILWLTLGDSNSGYFHAVTKTRKARNRLTVIEDEQGLPHYEEDKISTLICSYYEKLFTANHREENDVTIIQALKPCVTQEWNDLLTRDPSPEEIKDAMFSIHADKASGPDGFSASFFHTHWETIGLSVIKEIQIFFQTGGFAGKLN